MKKKYLCPQTKILIASFRKLMDDDWVIGGTVINTQGAKGGSFFGIDDYEETNDKPNYNVWDY